MDVTCAGCGTENSIADPEDGSWEPMLSVPQRAGDEREVVGFKLTMRCVACGHRTSIEKED